MNHNAPRRIKILWVLSLENAYHGLTENRSKYTKAIVTVQSDTQNKRMIFDLFSQALGNPPIAQERQFNLVTELLPQIVIGHRLWAHAASKRECFIRAEQIRFLHAASAKEVWVTIDFRKSDLRVIASTVPKLLQNSDLNTFQQVSPSCANGSDLSYRNSIVRIEQKVPHTYQSRPAEMLHDLSNQFGRRIWCIMRTVPPYRRYYFWGSARGARNGLDPLLSVYMVLFYLGSVTRYRPHYFEELQTSNFGNLFDEIINTQGSQMLFHLAAEFQQRDVSWPAVL